MLSLMTRNSAAIKSRRSVPDSGALGTTVLGQVPGHAPRSRSGHAAAM